MASPEGAPPPRERRFSSFAKAFLAPSSTRDSGRTATTRTLTNDQPLADPSTSAELKGLEPLAPIHSHEVLDLEAQATGHNSHQSSSPSTSYDRALTLVESTTWATSQSVPISPLDRSASDQPVLRSPQYNNSASNQPTNSTSRRPSSRFDRIHWKYAKFAFLCTIVLFITWVCLPPFLLTLSLENYTRSKAHAYFFGTIIGAYQRQPRLQQLHLAQPSNLRPVFQFRAMHTLAWLRKFRHLYHHELAGVHGLHKMRERGEEAQTKKAPAKGDGKGERQGRAGRTAW